MIAHGIAPPTTHRYRAFDSFVAAQADTTEFEPVEGVIGMMTNPTGTHEQIAGNIGVC